jgi:uncharacterized protein (TIGR00369 family)
MYEPIRQRIDTIIPLNRLLGIEIVSIGDGVAQARLPFRTEVTNHLGFVHATATFGIAEAASGCAVAGMLAAQITKIRPVASAGSVHFHKVTRSSLLAIARVVESPEALRERLVRSGTVELDVSVTVRDESDLDIASIVVTWHISRRNQPAALARTVTGGRSVA